MSARNLEGDSEGDREPVNVDVESDSVLSSLHGDRHASCRASYKET